MDVDIKHWILPKIDNEMSDNLIVYLYQNIISAKPINSILEYTLIVKFTFIIFNYCISISN